MQSIINNIIMCFHEFIFSYDITTAKPACCNHSQPMFRTCGIITHTSVKVNEAWQTSRNNKKSAWHTIWPHYWLSRESCFTNRLSKHKQTQTTPQYKCKRVWTLNLYTHNEVQIRYKSPLDSIKPIIIGTHTHIYRWRTHAHKYEELH